MCATAMPSACTVAKYHADVKGPQQFAKKNSELLINKYIKQMYLLIYHLELKLTLTLFRLFWPIHAQLNIQLS